jgi:hypothetical protein
MILVYKEDPSIFVQEVLLIEHTPRPSTWACYKLKDLSRMEKKKNSSPMPISDSNNLMNDILLGSYGPPDQDSSIYYTKEGFNVTSDIKYEMDDMYSMYRWILISSDKHLKMDNIQEAQDNENFIILDNSMQNLNNDVLLSLLSDVE